MEEISIFFKENNIYSIYYNELVKIILIVNFFKKTSK